MGASASPKISVAMCTNNLEINGISSVIMNYCCKIDLNRFNLTIIAGSPVASVYRMKCKELGIRLYECPNRKTSNIAYYSFLNKILSTNKFDIFHVHCNSATVTIELFLAWLHGIKIRIAHSHSTSCNHIQINKLLMPAFQRLYTHGLACGKAAGQWLFGDSPFDILPNGFQTKNFIFSPESRDKIRCETHTTENLVLGHIGRFNHQKNQSFLLEVFRSIGAKRKDAVLLLVGIGPDLDHIKSLVEIHPYKERIILYGETTSPAAIYAAMDVFLFPSKAEGLGIVALEAQISGLPCLASEAVPKDVVLGNQIDFLPIDSPDLWSERLASIEVKTENRNAFYDRNRERILKYDIAETVKQLEKIYTDLYQKIEDA